MCYAKRRRGGAENFKAGLYPICRLIESPDLAVVAFVALAVGSIFRKSVRDFQIN
jgi:hypothetical protein